MKKIRTFSNKVIEFVCNSDYADEFGDHHYEVWLSYKAKDLNIGQNIILKRTEHDWSVKVVEIMNGGDTLIVYEN
jgi:hypothetical protein